jgi:hypothetical protein
MLTLAAALGMTGFLGEWGMSGLKHGPIREAKANTEILERKERAPE